MTRRADVGQRVDEGLGLSELLGECDRPSAPAERPFEIVVEQPQLGEIAVGHRQFRPGRQGFQHLQRGGRAALPRLRAPRTSRSRDSQRRVLSFLEAVAEVRQMSSAA